MIPTRFPDPETIEDPNGLIAVSDHLSTELLIEGYSVGTFPWPMDEFPKNIYPWFSPLTRGILHFKDLHLPQSLKKFVKKNPFTVTVDKDFKGVIQACSKATRPGQKGTWLHSEMMKAYIQLHKAGFAHSVETWKNEKLVGGIYGVEIDGCFSGESMFFTEPNASKVALLHLIETLKSKGAEWIDIQMVTPHMKLLGAKSIRRSSFLRLLRQRLALQTRCLNIRTAADYLSG